jgi:hypothetical protein
MAHFAKISEDNIVLNVLTVNNSDMLNTDGVEDEAVGQQHLETHNNWPSHLWIQTSFNTKKNQHKNGGTPLRGNYAGIGYKWDSTNNIFWPPKPFESWVKNTSNACWNPPINQPSLTAEQQSQNDAGTHAWVYEWNETQYQADNTTGWELVNHLS